MWGSDPAKLVGTTTFRTILLPCCLLVVFWLCMKVMGEYRDGIAEKSVRKKRSRTFFIKSTFRLERMPRYRQNYEEGRFSSSNFEPY